VARTAEVPAAAAAAATTTANAAAIAWNGSSFKLSRDTLGSNPTSISTADVKNAFDDYLPDACKFTPNRWFPIEQKIFPKLQATRPPNSPQHQLRPTEYTWHGLLPGGHRMLLSYYYLQRSGHSRDCLRDCMKSGEPQACTRAGAAVALPPLAEIQHLASASAIVGVGAPKVWYQQGDKDTCVVSGLASAVHYMGEVEAASSINALADASPNKSDADASPNKSDAVKLVQTRCFYLLQPHFKTIKLKCASEFDPLSFAPSAFLKRLQLPRHAYVVTVMQIVDSGGDISHCVSMTSDGWLFDSNKSQALPLTQSGLDACCLGDATFASVFKGFHLVHVDKTAKRVSEGDSPDSPKKQRTN